MSFYGRRLDRKAARDELPWRTAVLTMLVVLGGYTAWSLVTDDRSPRVDACRDEIAAQLPGGGVPEYDVDSFEIEEFPDGVERATGTVESAGQTFYFECQTDGRLTVTDAVVRPQ